MTLVLVPVGARYYGAPRSRTDLVVWHATAGGSARSSLAWQNREGCPPAEQTSYHAIIERDGTVYTAAPLEARAFHAGRSSWPVPPAGVPPGGSVNGRSLGIAFANHNASPAAPHFERVTEAQLTAAIAWLRSLLPTYEWLGVPSRHVRHRDVAPGRKSDPHPDTLDWRAFRERIAAEVRP